MAHRKKKCQGRRCGAITRYNEVRGKWKLALVTKVVPSEDGRIRRVSVSYCVQDTGSRQEVERAVQRLVVIVPVEERNCGAGVFCLQNLNS